ncbi:hypothetical protein L6164_035821 [Bauhinia variegata]|uniref:Uncharacterized protein n=1 Tax=Bauhinia variegata TaxID=167791 RepID=A0ACB9KF62_BAUVA|nr:hypothetical protein L6164_035821 [Bauhinia variegata]
MTVVFLRLLSFLFVLVIPICQSTAQPSLVKYFCINKNGNYTANSTYQTNLNTLLSNLYSDTDNDYGFYNSSYGQNSDKVNAIAMCRGDVKPSDCRTCLNNSRVLLTQNCPSEKEAIGWYDKCMLRYSNRSIFGTMETDPPYYIWNYKNATSRDKYNEVVRDLLEKLRSKTASGDSRRKFAAANETFLSFQNIFAFLQCTPDLSEQQCNDCLVGSISDIGFWCAGRVRCRIFKPSCNLRFDTRSFYDPDAVDAPLTLPPPQASPPSSITNTTSTEEGKSNSSRTIIAIVVSISAFVVLLLIFICIFSKIRKARKFIESETDADEEMQPTGTLQFDFDTLKLSTNNFSDANKLGQGGFGPVYKGTLFNGQEVAVKRWFLVDQSQENTNRIVGTHGYIAPEYAKYGHFSIKSDIFSFGVLILEIVSGCKNNEIRDGEFVEHIVSFTWRNWREGTTSNIIDSTLDVGSRNEMMRCIHIGLLCVQENAANRPTMASVMLMLDSNSVTLAIPSQPAFSVHGKSLSETQSLEHNAGQTRLRNDTVASKNEASVTELYPR